MNEANTKRTGWKSKAIHEMAEYYIMFMYLAVFFGSFEWYRRLILAEYQISYLHYGAGVIKALILAKVIMVGQTLHLGRRFEDHSLILPTVYKAVVFTIFVGLFDIVEDTTIGLLHGKGIAAGFDEFMSAGWYELLSRCLVTFVAFIPFFAFGELKRVLGEDTLGKLFFRRRSAAESGLTKDEMPQNRVNEGHDDV
ncbi:conserved membrane hypothetical protein [Syntrophobacter sp. SbD1]|nr:conserved membrane hypothetical protein [Syntrophobacter sp. SbD1]